MTIVFEDLDLPSGALPLADVRVRLAGGGGRPVLGKVISTGKKIVGEDRLRLGEGIDSSGMWSLDLPANTDISPAGTTWFVRRQVGCYVYESYLSVPITGGPFEAFLLEDDPLGTITPSALAAHGSDLSLHGGGIVLDSKFITTSQVVTGTGGGLFGVALAGSQVTVPDVARPVILQARVVVQQQPGGPTEHVWWIGPAANNGIFASLNATRPAGINTTTPRPGSMWALLPAHSQGNYVIWGGGAGGNLTAVSLPTTLEQASLVAIGA